MTRRLQFWTLALALTIAVSFLLHRDTEAQQPSSPIAYDAVSYETLTVSTAALPITTAIRAPGGISTDFCYLTVEAQPVRYTTNGTTPTASVGHLVAAAGVIPLLGSPDITAFRIIRQAGVDATVQVTCSRRLSP